MYYFITGKTSINCRFSAFSLQCVCLLIQIPAETLRVCVCVCYKSASVECLLEETSCTREAIMWSASVCVCVCVCVCVSSALIWCLNKWFLPSGFPGNISQWQQWNCRCHRPWGPAACSLMRGLVGNADLANNALTLNDACAHTHTHTHTGCTFSDMCSHRTCNLLIYFSFHLLICSLFFLSCTFFCPLSISSHLPHRCYTCLFPRWDVWQLC